MHENGFPVIPIAPGQKYPGQCLNGQWRPMPGWSQFAKQKASEFQLGIWESYEDAGVGIPCGYVVGIDIDILEDPQLVMKIDALAREMLGDTPLLRIGREPKRMLVYRCEKPFSGRKRHPLEILALGQQFVAYGIHPDTQQPYRWPIETPDDTALEELPAVTEEMCREWLEKAWEMIPAELRPNSLGNDTGAPHVSSGYLEGDYEAVREALDYIHNHDVDYDSWIGVGMGIKGALGDAGQGLFEDWSARSQKDVPGYTAKTWASLKPRQKGAGSIYFLAKESGWVPRADLVFNPEKRFVKENPVDFSGLQPSAPAPATATAVAVAPEEPQEDPLNSIKVEPLPQPPQRIVFPPEALENVDGLISDITYWINRTAIDPQPELALMNVLTMLACVYGRRYRAAHWDTRPNLMTVGLAESGAGKDHSRKRIKALVKACGLEEIMMGERAVSGSGLISALQEHPRKLGQWDEFGRLMQMLNSSTSASHQQDVGKTITEIFTSSDSTFFGADYSTGGGQKKVERPMIIEPCLCLYGTSTPDSYFKALTSAGIENGELNRFIVVRPTIEVPDGQLRPRDISPPDGIVKKVKESADVRRPGAGNLTGISAITETDLMDVEFEEDALKLSLQLRDFQKQKTRNKEKLYQLWQRYNENTIKLAMISAISADPIKPIITMDRLLWAKSIVEYSIQRMVMDFSRNIADTEHEKNMQYVMKALDDLSGGDPMREVGRSAIVKKTAQINARTREPILADLMETGQLVRIEAEPTGGRGRPAVNYYWRRSD